MSFTSSQTGQNNPSIRVFKDTNGWYSSFKSGDSSAHWEPENYAEANNVDIDLSKNPSRIIQKVKINGIEYTYLNIDQNGAIHFSTQNNENAVVGGFINQTIDLTKVENNTVMFMGEYQRFIPLNGQQIYWLNYGNNLETGKKYIAFEFRSYFVEDATQTINYRVFIYEDGVIDVVVKKMNTTVPQKIYIGYKTDTAAYYWPDDNIDTSAFGFKQDGSAAVYYFDGNLTGLCARFNLSDSSVNRESDAFINIANLTKSGQCGSSTLNWVDNLTNTYSVVSRKLLPNNILLNNSTGSYSGLVAGDYSLQYVVRIIGESNTTYNINTKTITLTNATGIPKPTISSNRQPRVCKGDSVILSANTPLTNCEYLWSNGSTTKNITVTQSGNFTVLVKDLDSGCTSISNPFSVVVNDPPIVFITTNGSTNVCEGNSVILSANCYESINLLDSTICDSSILDSVIVDGIPTIGQVYVQYQWLKDGQEISGAVNRNYLINGVSQAGNYTVKITDAYGCVSVSEKVSVKINSLPSVPIITQEQDCENLILRARTPENTVYSNVSFRWEFLNNGNWTTLSNANTDLLVTQNNGTYRVRVANSSGCFKYSTSYNFVLNVLAKPVLTPAAANIALCENETVILSTTPVQSDISYQWEELLNNVYVPIANAYSNSFVVNYSGTFRLRITDDKGCTVVSDSKQVTISAAPLEPIVTVSGSTTLCTGQTVELSTPLVSGLTYQWFNGTSAIAGAITNKLTVSTTGSYLVEVTNSKDCKTRSKPIAVQALVATITQTYNCGTGVITLNAPPYTNVIYQWFIPSTSTTLESILQNSFLNTYTLTSTIATNYRLRIISTETGCQSVSSIVNARNLTVPSITLNQGNLTKCKSDMTPINYIINTSNLTTQSEILNIQYSYSTNNGASYSNGNSFTLTPSTLSGGVYNIIGRVTYNVGNLSVPCTLSTSTITLTIVDVPKPLLTLNSTGPITTNDQLTLNLPGYTHVSDNIYTYERATLSGTTWGQWTTQTGTNPSPTSLLISSLPAGTYKFRVTVSRLECTNFSDETAEIVVRQVPTLSISPNGNVCKGQILTFTISNGTTGATNTTQYFDGSDNTWKILVLSGSSNNQFDTTVASIGINRFRVQSIINEFTVYSNEVQITINEMPSIPNFVANSPTSICQGVPSTFTVQENSGTWSNDMELVWEYSTNNQLSWVTSGTTNNETKSFTYTIPSSGSVVLRITVRNKLNISCLSFTIRNITVHPYLLNPTIAVQAGQSTSICVGQSTTLSLTNNIAGINYQWQSSIDNTIWTNISGATQVNYSIPSDLSAGTYIYRILTNSSAGSCGSQSSSPITITVNAPPATPIITATPTSQCGSGPITLTVGNVSTSGVKFRYEQLNGTSWTPLNSTLTTNTTYTFTPNIAGQLSFRVTVISDATGCSSTSSSAVVSYLLKPEIASPDSDNEICQGTSLTLNIANYANVNDLTVRWEELNESENPDEWEIAPGVNNNINYTMSSSLLPGYYKFRVIISNSNNTCTLTSNELDVLVLPIPPTPTFTISETTGVCAGSTSILTLSSAPVANHYYEWLQNGQIKKTQLATTSTTSAEITYTATNNSGQNQYSVRIVEPNRCSATSEIKIITAYTAPILSNISNVTLCSGVSNTITFTSTNPNTDTTISYTISPSGSQNIGTLSISGNTLTIAAADNNNANPLTLTVNVTPNLQFNGTTVCSGVSKSFIITRNPVPTIGTINDISAVCVGSNIGPISVPGTFTSISWTGGADIGLTDGSVSVPPLNIPLFKATNTSINETEKTITVIPSYGSCTGIARTFKIKVKGKVTAPSSLTATGDIDLTTGEVLDLCYNGSSTLTVQPASLVGAEVYKWYVNDILLEQNNDSRTLDIADKKPRRNGVDIQVNGSTVTLADGNKIKVVTYDPSKICYSESKLLTLNFIEPNLNALPLKTVCAGEEFEIPITGSEYTSVEWTLGSCVELISNTTTLAKFRAINSTNSVQECEIIAIPKNNVCNGPSKSTIIKVNPAPRANLIVTNNYIPADSFDSTPPVYPAFNDTSASNKVTYWVNTCVGVKLDLSVAISFNTTGMIGTMISYPTTTNSKVKTITDYNFTNNVLSYTTEEIFEDTTYEIELTNNYNCRKIVIINVNIGPDFYAVVGNHVSCDGAKDGTIKLFTSYVDNPCTEVIGDSMIWDSSICDSVIIPPYIANRFIAPPIKVFVNDALYDVIREPLSFVPYVIKNLPQGYYGIRLVDSLGCASTKYVTIGERLNNFTNVTVKLNLNNVVSKNAGYINNDSTPDATVYLTKNVLQTIGAFTNSKSDCGLYYNWCLGTRLSNAELISSESNVELHGNSKVDGKFLYLTITNSRHFEAKTVLKIALKTTPFRPF